MTSFEIPKEELYIVIKNLFLKGYSPLDISEILDLPIEEVRPSIGRVLVEEFGMFTDKIKGGR